MIAIGLNTGNFSGNDRRRWSILDAETTTTDSSYRQLLLFVLTLRGAKDWHLYIGSLANQTIDIARRQSLIGNPLSLSYPALNNS